MSKYKDGIPCGHLGCVNHVTHPCEECGRIGGENPLPDIDYHELLRKYGPEGCYMIADELKRIANEDMQEGIRQSLEMII
jgi:hypothetical protein